MSNNTQWIYKHLMDLFNTGDLIRFKATGEVFKYVSSSGGSNFSSYIVVDLPYVGETEIGSKKVHEVEKVDKFGNCIDDFSKYK